MERQKIEELKTLIQCISPVFHFCTTCLRNTLQDKTLHRADSGRYYTTDKCHDCDHETSFYVDTHEKVEWE